MVSNKDLWEVVNVVISFLFECHKSKDGDVWRIWATTFHRKF